MCAIADKSGDRCEPINARTCRGRKGHVVDVCAAFPVEVVLFLVFALSSSAKHPGKRMAAWTARGWRAAAAQRKYLVR